MDLARLQVVVNDAMIVVSNDRLDGYGEVALRVIELQRGVEMIVNAQNGQQDAEGHELVAVALSDLNKILSKIRVRIQQNRTDAQQHILKGITAFAERCEVKAKPPAPVAEHPINDPAVRKQVLAMTGGVCTYCAASLTDGQPVEGQSTKLYVEHVVPSSKGGPDHLCNYVPSCGSCNSAKGDRHVLHFVRKVQPQRTQTVATADVIQMQQKG